MTLRDQTKASILIGGSRPDDGHVRAQRTWIDSLELAVSNGGSSMSRRLFPTDARLLAQWLLETADEIEGVPPQ